MFSGLMMEVQEILSGALGLKEEEPGEDASEAPPTIVAPKRRYGRRGLTCDWDRFWTANWYSRDPFIGSAPY